ncbi:hypothetical protein SHL15_0121 [Streptomyces hygroscopicus subsp. limoneus]|nr:hypothetical protein SHL15_0121 [Streptomyces hygroscopicus subsp. limoneus]
MGLVRRLADGPLCGEIPPRGDRRGARVGTVSDPCITLKPAAKPHLCPADCVR